MNSLIRRLAVLSVMWAMLELLLPGGKQQPAVRMVMGVLVMTALLSQAGQWLGGDDSLPAWSVQPVRAAQERYIRTALASAANQLESYCVRQLERAGYRAQAGVWLRPDGSVEKVELRLLEAANPLLAEEEIREHLARQLHVNAACIQLEGP